ncbi:hypothetical protein [Niveispirillum irakense]|uniref:hypothetical protein n=1 Tax=Niveispirillum irakense TaxID=34011 RepID=UPI0006853DBB|nr:hypothetical protein [Niveispirillum irakense]
MKKFLLIMSCTLLVAGLFLGFNIAFVSYPVKQELEEDERNDGITLIAYHQYLINYSTLVLDLRELRTSQASPLDITRMLFQSAKALKDKKFGKIILSYRGSAKFFLDGDYFKDLGEEFSNNQNPLYLMRTLPQNVKALDGTPEFGERSGGIIYVMTKQMEDLQSLHRRWWSNDVETAHLIESLHQKPE